MYNELRISRNWMAVLPYRELHTLDNVLLIGVGQSFLSCTPGFTQGNSPIPVINTVEQTVGGQ